MDVEKAQQWDSRGHLFAAAAEAMRRILVEHARRKLGKQRGGDRRRVEFNDATAAHAPNAEQIVEVSEAPPEDFITGQDQAVAPLINRRVVETVARVHDNTPFMKKFMEMLKGG